MAACSASSTATSCSISRPLSFQSSKLQPARFLRYCSPGSFRISPCQLSTLPRRRSLPVVKATKQTFSSFDDLLENADKPVLVDFYATWCGPCQFMVPILNEVSTQMKDKIIVVKIDTEKYPEIASRYDVEALPTFMIFRDGKPCYRFEGALHANQLIELIEDVLRVTQ